MLALRLSKIILTFDRIKVDFSLSSLACQSQIQININFSIFSKIFSLVFKHIIVLDTADFVTFMFLFISYNCSYCHRQYFISTSNVNHSFALIFNFSSKVGLLASLLSHLTLQKLALSLLQN